MKTENLTNFKIYHCAKAAFTKEYTIVTYTSTKPSTDHTFKEVANLKFVFRKSIFSFLQHIYKYLQRLCRHQNKNVLLLSCWGIYWQNMNQIFWFSYSQHNQTGVLLYKLAAIHCNHLQLHQLRAIHWQPTWHTNYINFPIT